MIFSGSHIRSRPDLPVGLTEGQSPKGVDSRDREIKGGGPLFIRFRKFLKQADERNAAHHKRAANDAPDIRLMHRRVHDSELIDRNRRYDIGTDD